jgi:hypothetical protein
VWQPIYFLSDLQQPCVVIHQRIFVSRMSKVKKLFSHRVEENIPSASPFIHNIPFYPVPMNKTNRLSMVLSAGS